jgi:DNA-binding MarR family transcriptional regulator
MGVSARKRESAEDATPPFRSAAFMLSTVGYAVSRRFHEILKPLDLEPGEFALLRAVAASDGEAQNALAERLHISPSWMVAVVDELESRGLIARRPHARDRRVRHLHLTAEGKKLLRRAEQQARRFDGQVTEPLGETELRQLLALLDRVAAGLELHPGAHAALRDRG